MWDFSFKDGLPWWLRKDSNLPKGISDVLADVSMGRAKNRRFLSNKDNKQVNSMWNSWKDLCLFTTNVASKPIIANKRMLVWKRLDEFPTFPTKQRSTTTFEPRKWRHHRDVGVTAVAARYDMHRPPWAPFGHPRLASVVASPLFGRFAAFLRPTKIGHTLLISGLDNFSFPYFSLRDTTDVF